MPTKYDKFYKVSCPYCMAFRGQRCRSIRYRNYAEINNQTGIAQIPHKARVLHYCMVYQVENRVK